MYSVYVPSFYLLDYFSFPLLSWLISFKHSHLSFPIKTVVLLLFSRQVVFDSLRPHGRQHARLPCPSPSPGVCLHSCSLNRWCHPTISSSDKDRSANYSILGVLFFVFCFGLEGSVAPLQVAVIGALTATGLQESLHASDWAYQHQSHTLTIGRSWCCAPRGTALQSWQRLLLPVLKDLLGGPLT